MQTRVICGQIEIQPRYMDEELEKTKIMGPVSRSMMVRKLRQRQRRSDTRGERAESFFFFYFFIIIFNFFNLLTIVNVGGHVSLLYEVGIAHPQLGWAANLLPLIELNFNIIHHFLSPLGYIKDNFFCLTKLCSFLL